MNAKAYKKRETKMKAKAYEKLYPLQKLNNTSFGEMFFQLENVCGTVLLGR